ncbi:MAG TPA: TIGR00282 family metallophosphoesterase [Trueperaceae bacterium]|nr:TIGR00282 family metallophosphoesterase [Trueperaceae bacterium]
MRVLFIGDIFSTPGMKVARDYLAQAADEYDFIIANGENAAGGFGITRKHFDQLRNAGVDVVTLGNHGFDQSEALELAEETPRLVRPVNYPPGTPGVGWAVFEARSGERVSVAQAMGRVFMDPLDDPFRALDDVLEGVPEEQAVIVDFHAEATSEKRVMLYHLAGRVSAVIGTHTHVQTADETVFKGTAYITDAGMSGVQASSIGMGFEEVHARFVAKLPRRFRPAGGHGTLNGVVLEIEGRHARSIRRLQWSAPTGG